MTTERKRKIERNGEWHEFLDWDEASDKKPRKLKLLADENIPFGIVDFLRFLRFKIDTVKELRHSGQPDENILQIAKRMKAVLMTTDKDFWDERKHPIQKCYGLICIEAGPQDGDKIASSFFMFYDFYGQHYGFEDWKNTKAFISSKAFTIRQVVAGKIEEDEYLFQRHKLLTRKIR